ncbi:CheR family methyltransferase [Rugamonas sp. CCM 8940]|uniref:CheR family methyltransferase n=1 Tax=Rugamonas sp. CCM 8940 TaxID=2765359 RepID=UPI0018F3429C|nr:protein-glutamate O-methyltransferase CheR [Rugamonas sp. CCM 8940]MBJ7308842.1 methyltransferase domain-containing protein [Rugamonas sp. CCM 8940]
MSPQALLRQASGLNLSEAQAERAVAARMARLGASDRAAYLAALAPAELEALVELVVVPESWLFRDPQAFVAAADFVVRRLATAAGAARPLRILSVPCAGGEEPYSIAMALCDAGVAPAAFNIDAVDISAANLARARAGVYGRNAFRGDELGFRQRYFSAIGGQEYRVLDSIARQVRFEQGNLLAPGGGLQAGHYDLIFCRNLLIYFDPATTAAAIARLNTLLADDGLLFAGYAEVPSFCQHGFVPLAFPLAFGLRKRGAAAAAAAAGRPPPAAAPRVRAPARPAAAAPAAPAAPASKPAAGTSPAPGRAHTSATPAPAPAPEQDAELLQARRLADQGQFEQAGAACQAWLEQHPDSAEAYFILGLLMEHAGQPLQAREHWRRCIYLQPDHYEALCHLALLAEQQRDSATAVTLKARAARIYKRQQAT